MDELIWIHLAMGPLMLLLSLLYKKYPPRKINFIYGYRTERSMKNLAAWECANMYSANGLIVVALATMVLQLVFYFLFDSATVLLFAAVFLLTGLIIVMLLTERELKRKNF